MLMATTLAVLALAATPVVSPQSAGDQSDAPEEIVLDYDTPPKP
jgi:hypothetical protein